MTGPRDKRLSLSPTSPWLYARPPLVASPPLSGWRTPWYHLDGCDIVTSPGSRTPVAHPQQYKYVVTVTNTTTKITTDVAAKIVIKTVLMYCLFRVNPSFELGPKTYSSVNLLGWT